MAAASTAAPVVARTLIADVRKETKGLGDPATVTLNVNDREHRVPRDPRATLLDALPEHLGLTGTKKGCDHGRWRPANVGNRCRVREGARPHAHRRNSRAAYRRRFRRSPHLEHAHGAQPVYRRHDLGHQLGIARSDRDRRAPRTVRQ
jgi:hypothetical protein